VNIENITREGFSTRRPDVTRVTIHDTLERDASGRHKTISNIAALFHKVLSNTGSRHKAQGTQAPVDRSLRLHHHGVFQRALFTQRRNDFGNTRSTLSNGAINAQHILAALIQYSIKRNRRFAGCRSPRINSRCPQTHRNQGHQ